MAYTDDEYRVTIRGTVGPAEEWANTWSFLDVSSDDAIADAVTRFHTFYGALLEIQSTSYHVLTCAIKNLGTGVTVFPIWEDQVGTNGAQLLPTQLAVRVSLDDNAGHRGGPFLCGFTEGNNADNGLLSSTHQTLIAGAVDSLAANLVTDGLQLRIDRPSVAGTVVALQCRVGQRFDVIRKRGNDTVESYVAASLA